MTELASDHRPSVHGRALNLGNAKLHVRGVTYGTFDGPSEAGGFPAVDRVEADFAAMADCGLNAVRTYTVPPRWLLDIAQAHRLRVLVGIPWEQHVTFIDMPERRRSIRQAVRDGVRACADHPAVLGYAVGSEIPATIVRWHGRRRIERFLEDLFLTAKAEDPQGLVTYVNYPSTEYLDLPFLDLVCFNVFLEEEGAFEAYLARLQNIAGDRPLLVTESGLDSSRNGGELQAAVLRWQIRHSFAMGAAGVFVFAWTDEWHRDGNEVVDWDFGVVDRDRRPKPSLEAIREAFAEAPFPRQSDWPRISVVVCTHNGERTLPECLRRLTSLRYPNYEVIVVSDGSTDGSERIVEESSGCTLVRSEHRGLGAARNAGVERSTGEMIAFLDDDAYPDGDWLHYLAAAFRDSEYAAIGGPNIPPPDESWVASCVAAAPGAPIHVLLSDREAEHVPGCNMAFRRSALKAVAGFDERFRVAGDDVDICWRLQDRELTVGFSAGAVVMHRRRDSIRRYLRQQFEYGKAEALLERKWPSRYNRAGYLSWTGRIYGRGRARSRGKRGRIRYGIWGSGLFQSVYQPAAAVFPAPLWPEWFLLVGVLGVLSLLAPTWGALIAAVPLFAVSIGALAWQATARGWAAHFRTTSGSRADLLRRRLLTSLLFALQPLARLAGRIRQGLVPWRRRAGRARGLPVTRTGAVWSEQWASPTSRAPALEHELIAAGARVRRGGEFDPWDLRVWAGPLGFATVLTTVEEHGSGRQLARCRARPQASWLGVGAIAVLGSVALAAWVDGAAWIATMLSLGALLTALRASGDCSAAIEVALRCFVRSSLSLDEHAEPLPSPSTARVRLRGRPQPALEPSAPAPPRAIAPIRGTTDVAQESAEAIR